MLPALRTTSVLIGASSAAYFGLRHLSASSQRVSASAMSSAALKIRQRKGGFPAQWPYKPADFHRMDESVDSDFYSQPRFVEHIDDRCIAHLSDYYGSVLPKPTTDDASKPRVLDIASSWISHLSEDWDPSNSHVVGVGMNKAELSKNRALSRYFVADLNEDPNGLSKLLKDEKESFDAAVCSVSIDYLVKPREMLADVATLLKPGASVHLAFSNRCFPTKACGMLPYHYQADEVQVVGRWLNISESGRCDMVADYLHFAGSSERGTIYRDIEIVTVLERSYHGDPLWVTRAFKT